MTDAAGTPAGPLRAIVEELVGAGVRNVVICPGSRSTPLALALRAAPGLRSWVHLDERAGAFFALGAAKAGRQPVAILATSGTAVVNFAPAVVEARYGRVPLVLLTADRPPELHGVGFAQTIDQAELYGRHAKWYAQLPVPDRSAEAEAEVRTVVAHAVDVATTEPAGPVQLDLPFREPLLPDGSLTSAALAPSDLEPRVVVAPELADLDRAVEAVAGAARPLIVCGPMDARGFGPAVMRLAAATDSPILADALSNVRTGPHDRSNVIAHYDLTLRHAPFRDASTPDLVLRFGANPTSKILNQLIDGLDVPQLLVDEGAGWNRASSPTLIAADPVSFAEALAGEVAAAPSTEWLTAWRAADRAAADAIDAWMAALEEPFEGAVAWALDEALPDGTIVVAGNSMPIRDIDAFMTSSPRARRMLGSRGASGIDGQLSSALGAAVVQSQPVVAVLGDLSLIHDLNALVAARRLGIDATVVLVDNDGGGIFSFLPQAAADRPEIGLPEHYEDLFGTPHGLDLAPVVEALGARHQRVDQHTLGPALKAATGRPGLDVLGLVTERRRNVELHDEAFQAVAHAIEVAS